MITLSQCRAARGLIGWKNTHLSKAAGVSGRTITDFERGARQPINATLQAIQNALESAGVEFIPGNGGGPGVRLRNPSE